MVMQEYRVILPDDTPIQMRAAKWFEKMLLQSFGGFTKSFGAGMWQDPATDKVFSESVVIFDVAIDPALAEDLRAFAVTAAGQANELTVYFRRPSGAEIIPVSGPQMEPNAAFNQGFNSRLWTGH